MSPGKQKAAISAAERSASRRLVFGLCFYALMAVAAWLWRAGIYSEPIFYAPGAAAGGTAAGGRWRNEALAN